MRMNEKHAAFTHKTESQLYKIGMFAQMNHVTVKALRFYDELFSFMPEMGAEQGRCRVNPYNIFYNAHSSYRYFYHLNFLQLSFHLFFLSDSRNRASCFFSFFLKYKNNPKKRIISNPPNPHRKILVPISSLTIPITTMQTPSTISTNMQMSDNIDSLLYLFIQYP